MPEAWKQAVILGILLVLFVIGIFGLFGLRRNLSKAPSVQVNIEDVTYTDKDKVTVTGKTDKNADLKVNGQSVPVANDGSFSFDQTLSEGDNKVTVESTANGKTTTVEKKIVRQSAEKNVNGTSTQNSLDANNLNNSGPVENVMGTIGLTAILLSYIHYRKTKEAV